MATYRDWPDGKAHSISWAQHQANLAHGQGTVAIGNTPVTQAQWQSGALATALAPPAAAPAADAAPPYDPGYEAYKLSAGRNVALGNNEATWQTQNLGYNSGYNADGTTNAANPYNQAQLLQDAWHRDQLGTNNSLAAAGQYSSGARVNAQATNDRNYAQSDAALKQQTQQGYHQIGYNQAQTYATNAVGVSDQGFNSLLRPYGS